MKTINSNGMQQIHDFLGEYHKKGYSHFTNDMLAAWASEAEFQMSEGNQPTIELKPWECNLGRSMEFTINLYGVDNA